MRHTLHALLLLALALTPLVVCAAPWQGVARARAVVAIAFSPDGRTVVSGGLDRTLRLWDVKTGRLLRTINVYPETARADGIVESVAFAPDGRTVLTASHYRLLQQWDVKTGERLRLFDGYACGVRCGAASFAPDGKTVAGAQADAGVVKIWDARSGRVLRTFAKPRDEKSNFPYNAEHILFSADGKRLFADGGPGGMIQVWDVETGRELLRFQTKAVINSLALSPDGRVLMVGGSLPAAPRNSRGLIALLSAETGRPLRVFPPQWDAVKDVAFALDGKLAASAGYDVTDEGSGAYAVKLWDVTTGEEVRSFPPHRPGARGRPARLLRLVRPPRAVAAGRHLV